MTLLVKFEYASISLRVDSFLVAQPVSLISRMGTTLSLPPIIGASISIRVRRGERVEVEEKILQ